MKDDQRKCRLCGREKKPRCETGEMVYSDGSWAICPNWNKRLDEIGGMTSQEADEAARWNARFR